MHSLTEPEVREALAHIDAHDRDTWVRMGMAVKAELGSAGFDAWDEWSASADNYNARAAKSVWRSIKASGGTTIASLIHAAESAGWTPPWKGQREDSAERMRAREQEIARQRERRERERHREEARVESGRKRAIERAAAMMQSAEVAEHGYLKAKCLGDVKGLVLPDHALFVPMRNVRDNALQGAQLIRLENNAWTKKMIPGMRAKGAVLRLGARATSETVLCEGYATGLSIDRALRQMCLRASVVVCFSASNLKYVAGQIGGRRLVFADHDASGVGEAAAQATGLPYCMSPEVGEDANDVHVRAGLPALCRLLMEVRRRTAA